MYLFIHLFIYSFIYLFIYLFIHLFIYLCIRVFFLGGLFNLLLVFFACFLHFDNSNITIIIYSYKNNEVYHLCVIILIIFYYPNKLDHVVIVVVVSYLVLFYHKESPQTASIHNSISSIDSGVCSRYFEEEEYIHVRTCAFRRNYGIYFSSKKIDITTCNMN